MWIGKEMARAGQNREEQAGADFGVTTIGGAAAAVETRGEERELPVFGPGGYCWQPRAGDTVLVIKGGMGGEERCVAAAEPAEPPEDMKPGEVCIRSEGASIFLREDGTITISGTVNVAGSLTLNGVPVAVVTAQGGGQIPAG